MHILLPVVIIVAYLAIFKSHVLVLIGLFIGAIIIITIASSNNNSKSYSNGSHDDDYDGCSSSNGRRCGDGSLDMRYNENSDYDKYND